MNTIKCPNCGKQTPKDVPSKAINAVEEIMGSALDCNCNPILDIGEIDSKPTPKQPRCYWCDTVIDLKALNQQRTPASNRTENIRRPERQPDPEDGRSLRERAEALYEGKGVKKDKAKGNELYLKAAKAGDTVAMMHMAMEYLFGGSGVNKDLEQYEYWLNKAADGGHSSAVALLKKRESKNSTASSIVNIKLEDPGRNKPLVVKLIYDICGFGIAESMKYANSAPVNIMEGVAAEKAKAIKRKLEDAGASVTLFGD